MLPYLTDDLEAIPEPLREHYIEDGDGYRLGLDGFDGDKLKSALDKERDRVKQLRAQLKSFEGVDVDELTELRQRLEEYETSPPTTEWEEREKRLMEREARKLEREAKKREDAEAKAEQYRERFLNKERESAVMAALSEHNANVKLLLPHVLNRVQVLEEPDGDIAVVARALDDDSETDVASLVGQMAGMEEWQAGFRASGRSGGGATSSAGGRSAGGKVRSKKDLKSAADHSRYISEHGLAAYQELPRE